MHAGGAAAHGMFESYGSASELTCAGFLQPGRVTPVFSRFAETEQVACHVGHLARVQQCRACEHVRAATTRPAGQAWVSALVCELGSLIDAVAAEANHEQHRRRQKRLDAAYDGIAQRE